MKRKWKERYSRKFRCRAVERMNACENIVRLSRELRVCRTLLYKWRYQLEPTEALCEGAPPQNCRESTLRREIGKLKRLLADKMVEVDFFRGALQKVEARRQRTDISGVARQFEHRANVPIGAGQQSGILPLSPKPGSSERGHHNAIDHPGDRPGTSATLPLSADRSGTATTRDDGKPQTRVANDAGGQSVDDPKS